MNETVVPPTMREVRPAAPPDPAIAPPPPPPRKRRRWLRLGVALVLAAVAIVGWERWERIAPGTVEEKIWELQQSKAQTIADVLGEEGFARSLTATDLEYLFAED